MFTTENVMAVFKKGVLKLEKEEDGYRRVAEATCVIEPFPSRLAKELGAEVAGHLFEDDDSIRPELEAIDLRIRAGLMNVTVRADRDLDPIALITPVSMRDVRVTRVEDKKTNAQWLSFQFVLVFSLEEKATRDFVLDRFGHQLLWTFERMQGDLLDRARLHEAAARLGEQGETAIITPDGKRVEFNQETSRAHRETAKNLRDKAH